MSEDHLDKSFDKEFLELTKRHGRKAAWIELVPVGDKRTDGKIHMKTVCGGWRPSATFIEELIKLHLEDTKGFGEKP